MWFLCLINSILTQLHYVATDQANMFFSISAENKKQKMFLFRWDGQQYNVNVLKHRAICPLVVKSVIYWWLTSESLPGLALYWSVLPCNLAGVHLYSTTDQYSGTRLMTLTLILNISKGPFWSGWLSSLLQLSNSSNFLFIQSYFSYSFK